MNDRDPGGALFDLRESWNGDPLDPDLSHPTPPEIVARLGASDRARRVEALIAQAHKIVDAALADHLDGKTLAARCILYSGGNDSTVLAHLMRKSSTHAIHCNTTIGIEATRQFVRDTCKTWELPLVEETAPVPYRDLVMDQGFPGPGMHWKMYQRLKERPLRQARRRLVSDRSQRILFLAGRRRLESDRRSDIPLHEREGSIIWASPLAMWSKLDLTTYRLMHAKSDPVPVNEVTDILHMSGECLCGAFAKPGELDEIGEWFPEVRAEIESIQKAATEAGYRGPLNRWGHGTGVRSRSGRMCSSCEAEQLDLGIGDGA